MLQRRGLFWPKRCTAYSKTPKVMGRWCANVGRFDPRGVSHTMKHAVSSKVSDGLKQLWGLCAPVFEGIFAWQEAESKKVFDFRLPSSHFHIAPGSLPIMKVHVE